ncbi:hypothetical protein [Ensifer soli]|uniref:hypothetical protein n=1 Tax=Ciceribacter sp. sgz301302 TaxID=3342379 RepID=UPI0035B7CE82
MSVNVMSVNAVSGDHPLLAPPAPSGGDGHPPREVQASDGAPPPSAQDASARKAAEDAGHAARLKALAEETGFAATAANTLSVAVLAQLRPFAPDGPPPAKAGSLIDRLYSEL